MPHKTLRSLSFVSLASLLIGCDGIGLGGSSADRQAFDALLQRINYHSPYGDGPLAVPPEYQDKVYECYHGEAQKNEMPMADLTAALNEISARATNADMPPGTPEHQHELGNYYLYARQFILNCQNTLIPPSAVRAFVQKVNDEYLKKEMERKLVSPARDPAIEAVPEATAEVAVTPPAAVPALIAGKWVSIDDEKSSITVTADGKWTDSYSDGTKDETYPWRVINGVEAKAASPTNEFTPEATYLEVKRTEATYYYELGEIDAENLDMFYVGRGNRLAYKRAK